MEIKNYKPWAEAKPVRPLNFGWLEYKLGEEEMKYVWKCIENKQEDCKKILAGNIDSSFHLKDEDDWFFGNTITPLIHRYKEDFRNLADPVPVNQKHPYHMSRWWVNYQKQNEFNPMHDHTGVYSYVIWMKIPTHFFEQNKNEISLKANTHRISAFDFVYTNTLGDILSHCYQLGPGDEGTMLFFPSALKHQVYPFYNCDETRISVSGNIALDTTKTIPVQ